MNFVSIGRFSGRLSCEFGKRGRQKTEAGKFLMALTQLVGLRMCRIFLDSLHLLMYHARLAEEEDKGTGDNRQTLLG